MKRLLLFTACLAALSACSDDETTDRRPPVVGDVQFAAAIDPAETRVAWEGAVPVWETGDRIGITALLDGTPYIENVPYTLTDATSFSLLTPADEAIRWNESVTGRRTFFACYPYDQSNAGGLMNRAVVRFSAPAEQHVAGGVNTTEPLLVGHAATSAAQQQPVALRFRNFTSLLELRFEPLEETAIATIEIAPADGSPLTGWLTGAGTTDNLGSVTLSKTGDRLKVICDGDGLPLDRARSVLIPLGHFTTAEGGLTLRAVTTDERVFSETIFAGEPYTSYVTDDAGGFLSAKYTAHTMRMEVISDETREVYFKDDFDWITASSRWDNLTGGGWPTMTAANSATGKANYFTLDLIDDFDQIGYTTAGTRTDVQARYEGYVCLGISSRRAALVTPALSKIGDEPRDLLVSFHGANYASATMTPDTKPLTISVEGPGTIGESGESETEIALTSSFRWRKYWIIVKGATSATKIVFGKADATAGGRILIDNLLIGRAVKGAVEGSRDVPSSVKPEIRLPEGNRTDVDNLAGAEASLIIQSTTSWSAACDADWLAVSPMTEALGTGIAYRLTFHALAQNLTGETRTATVTVTAGDQATATLTVTQSGEIPAVVYFEDDFGWCTGDGSTGGIFDATLTNKTAIGSGGKTYNNWTAAYKATGWTAVMLNNSPTTRNGTLLVGGTTKAPGDVISPAFESIGDTPTNIVVEYDVLEYKNASETGESRITIYAGGGRIVSIEGNYTPENDSYTSLDPDGRTQYYYSGGYTDWSKGDARWHHIRVEIEGATAQTQVQLAGTSAGGFCRFWLDNLRVTQKQ